MLSKFKRLLAILSAFVIAVLSAVPVSAGIEHLILHQPTTGEPFITVSNAYHATYQWYIADLNEDEAFTEKTDVLPVDGQISRYLTAIPDGKKYVCEIIWSDGTKKFSDVITNSYAITHQPSASEPYVTLNNYSGAIFQWYKSNFSSVTVADIAGENTLAASTVYDGSYAEGLWQGAADTPVDIEFELKENQLLTVTPSAGFDGTVEEYGEAFLSSRSGVYTYFANEDARFNLCIENDESFSAKVEIITFTNASPVSGQTSNTLSLNADGEYYFCEITGNGNAKLTTPSFKFDLAITHQPDAKEPFVEINTNKSTAFRWFETTEATYKITDNPTDENELEIRNLWVGSYENGQWNSNALGTFEGQVLLRKGQTVSIVLPENFEGGVGGLQLKNGAYTYTAETNEKFHIYLKNPTTFALDIYISELKNEKEITELTQNKFTLPVDGKTYRCSVFVDGNELLSDTFVNSYTITRQPAENEHFVETNDNNEVSYQWYKVEKKLLNVTDSVSSENEIVPYHIYKGVFAQKLWQSQNGRLDFELSLKKNDVILVSLSDDLNQYVTVNEIETSFSDGIFAYIVPCNGLFNLFVSSPSSAANFSATVKVLRGVRSTLLNDANATLNAISNGEYLCSVTFSDGTMQESDFITVTNGALDSLEKELGEIAENVTENDKEAILEIAAAASELSPADTDETERIKAISDTAANLLGIITQKSNAVTSLVSAVEEYDIGKLVPSDKNALVSIKGKISDLLEGGNLSQNQINALTALIDDCDRLIEKIDSLNITVSIVNNPKKTEINYGQTITLRASATDMPTGSKIVWYVDGESLAEGECFDFSPEKDSAATVKLLDENGTVILGKDAEEISDTEQIDVKTNFFIRLINFFKKLFGISQTIVQTVV